MTHHQPTVPAGDTVVQDVALHCEDELGRPLAFIATCRYHADDPYAVWLTLHVPVGDVPWVMARSLLVRGLTEPVGDGDIRLWPTLDDQGRAMVGMDFRTPEGRLLVEARSAEVLAFLIRTWEVVPIGSEGSLVDLDELVESLLA